MWHKAIGGPLKSVPEESWLRVIQEKHPDMLHLLQFPYNGEPPKVIIWPIRKSTITDAYISV
jgi:sulfite oxidase